MSSERVNTNWFYENTIDEDMLFIPKDIRYADREKLHNKYNPQPDEEQIRVLPSGEMLHTALRMKEDRRADEVFTEETFSVPVKPAPIKIKEETQAEKILMVDKSAMIESNLTGVKETVGSEDYKQQDVVYNKETFSPEKETYEIDFKTVFLTVGLLFSSVVIIGFVINN